TLNGNGGNDTLDGGSGVDTMNGGNGNDLIYFSDFTDHIDGGDGFDTISFAKIGHGITADNTSFNSAGGSVTQVEGITGTKYADHIDESGGPGIESSTVHGGSGNDFVSTDGTLYGDAGNDRLVPQGVNQYGDFWTPDAYGGTGHDTFVIDYVYALHNLTG